MRTPKLKIKSKHIIKAIRTGFWFSTGVFLSLFFLSTFSFLVFQKISSGHVYPGIIVSGKNLGGMTVKEVEQYFDKKNESINTVFEFKDADKFIATASAKQLEFGYDGRLLSSQAITIGRSKNIPSNIYLIIKAYVSGIFLPPAYRYSQEKLKNSLADYIQATEKTPIDAQFKFENGKVTAFKASSDGQSVDLDKLNTDILEKGVDVSTTHPKTISITIPIKVLKPKVTTESVNKFGIKELIGMGTSSFAHSIPSRIHNIGLAASRINGALVKPGEVFSFDNALGDVSAFTGYQQAYVIKDGKTVLGDGGGVCQVSTTFFRSLLNAGLPITERHPHSYRVGYYEQDSPPGFDATVYVPTVDIKFKNDTGNYILIQTSVDYDNLSLAFYLYGTKDGREVSISKVSITNQTPPPPPLYQDDPGLPKGVIKQVDFEASGANVSFTREVKKDNKVIIAEKYVSNYSPWQAVFLRGTQ